MRFPGWTLSVLAAILVGCATGSAGSSAGAELSPLLDPAWQPFLNQTCTLVPAPAWASAPERLVHLDAAHTVLAQSEGEANEPAPYVVLDVRFGEDGSRRMARVVESNVAPDVEERIVGAVVDRVPQGAPQGEPGGMALLRLEGADPVQASAGPGEYCACAVMNRREISRILERGVRSLRDRGVPAGRHDFVVEVLSDVEGNILEKRFAEASDIPAVNAMVNAAVVRMEVAPPIRNRSPDPGWSRLPISVVIPSAW